MRPKLLSIHQCVHCAGQAESLHTENDQRFQIEQHQFGGHVKILKYLPQDRFHHIHLIPQLQYRGLDSLHICLRRAGLAQNYLGIRVAIPP